MNIFETFEEPWGELFIQSFKKDEKNIHCIYTIDPDDAPQDDLLQIENFSYDIKNFNDLAQFLNYDFSKISNLAKSLLGKIYIYVYDKKKKSKLSSDISDDLNTINNEIKKISPFFHFYTEYHVYNLLMCFFIQVYIGVIKKECLRTGIQEALESLEISEISENSIQEIAEAFDIDKYDKQESLKTYKTFEKSLSDKIIPDKTSYRYLEIRQHHKENFKAYVGRSSFLPPSIEFGFEIKKFIINNMPLKSFKLTSTDWQLFLYKLFHKYQNVLALSPYSLTHHIKLIKIKEYRKLLNNIPTNLRPVTLYSFPEIMQTLYEQSQKRKTNHENSLPFYFAKKLDVNVDSLFLDSNNECKSTYPISSFEQYIVAEIKEMCRNNVCIKLCPKCGEYYTYHKNFPEHQCPDTRYINTSEQIHKLYASKKNIESSYYRKIVDELSYDKRHDKPFYDICWDEFVHYHDLVYYTSIRNQLSLENYERFINNESYKYHKFIDTKKAILEIEEFYAAKDFNINTMLEKTKKLSKLQRAFPDIDEFIENLKS